jgi:hypothetical protein
MPSVTSGWAKTGVLGAEPDVAGEGELAAPAEGVAVDGGDDRLRQRLDRVGDGVAEAAERFSLLRPHRRHPLDVGAGRERLVAGSGQDRAADIALVAQAAERREERLDWSWS